MQNKFIKNIIFLLFLNLLVKPFWILGVDREVQNMLGDKSYGLYLAIFNFSYLFYIILDLGITNFNSRNIAQDNKLLSKHFAGLSAADHHGALMLRLVSSCFCQINECTLENEPKQTDANDRQRSMKAHIPKRYCSF